VHRFPRHDPLLSGLKQYFFPLRPFLMFLVVIPGLFILQACDDSVARPESQLGGIEITTTTVSPTELPDSFTVLLNGSEAGRMGRDDIYVVPYLPAGKYLVELEDNWEGCWFGSNRRTITVEARDTVPITYLIRCEGEPSLLGGGS